MAKIHLEIDTQDAPVKNGDSTSALVAQALLAQGKKLGIVSSIGLDADMLQAIEFGFGSNKKHKDKAGYDQSKIKLHRNHLVKVDKCDVIAAVGGSVVHSAIQADMEIPWVALMADIPSPPGQYCRGGVSLESWKTNLERITFLLTKLSLPATDVYKIGLYRNYTSNMAGPERDDWRTHNPDHSGVERIINSTMNFDKDLNGVGGPSIVPANIQALVISADPQFQDKKTALAAAASTWASGQTGGADRHVVFPLTTYGAALPQNYPQGRITLIGPDLIQAYRLLGFMAKHAAEYNQYQGFYRASNQTIPL